MNDGQLSIAMDPDSFPDDVKEAVLQKQEENTVKQIILHSEMNALSGNPGSVTLIPNQVLALARLLKRESDISQGALVGNLKNEIDGLELQLREKSNQLSSLVGNELKIDELLKQLDEEKTKAGTLQFTLRRLERKHEVLREAYTRAVNSIDSLTRTLVYSAEGLIDS